MYARRHGRPLLSPSAQYDAAMTSSSPVVLIGVPSDENSSFMRGCAAAPDVIRAALVAESTNTWTETGVDLSVPGVLDDAGDLDLGLDGLDFEAIEPGARRHLDSGCRLLAMGGDHAVTHPLVRATVASRLELRGELTILHFDAHPDLYDDFEGNPRSHASPFARILEEGLTRRLVQVGIRTLNAHQREQAARFDVEVIEARHWERTRSLSFDGPLYISFDMDALDPSCAPGVSHWEPGGPTTRQALDLIQAIDTTRASIVGADVVELNPARDMPGAEGFTAMVAARVLREIAGKMLET